MPAPGPALWRAERDGNAAFLFGTIHFGVENARWHTPLIDQLVEDAEIVLLERGQFTRERIDIMAVTLWAQFKPSVTLIEALPDHQKPRLELLCRELRIDADRIGSLSPVVAASILSSLIASRSGRDQAFGVDSVIYNAAKDRCAPIEPADVWSSVFKRDVQMAMATDETIMSLNELGFQLTRLEQLDDAYHRGDLAVFAEQNMISSGYFRDVFLTSRNTAWANVIERTVRRGSKVLAAGGLAHFVGHDGVCALMAKKGFSITMEQGIPHEGMWPI